MTKNLSLKLAYIYLLAVSFLQGRKYHSTCFQNEVFFKTQPKHFFFLIALTFLKSNNAVKGIKELQNSHHKNALQLSSETLNHTCCRSMQPQ